MSHSSSDMLMNTWVSESYEAKTLLLASGINTILADHNIGDLSVALQEGSNGLFSNAR